MPTPNYTFYAVDAATGTTNINITNRSVSGEPKTPPRYPLVFTMQENTAARELRLLRDSQPRQVLQHNYSLPITQVLNSERNAVRTTIREYCKFRWVKGLFVCETEKNKRHARDLISTSYSSGAIREIERSDLSANQTVRYIRVLDVIATYQDARQSFIENRKIYGEAQARYNQQAALIRQKPRKLIAIDTQKLLNTLSQWDNIWGISLAVFEEECLIIRIGLCNIVMSESATKSAYAEPKDIKLAPFIFTIKLHDNGSFTCPSRQRNVRGLSRTNHEEEDYRYDIHPHQMSDSPCFGSFGQTLVDQASKGDVISLVGSIIAFYSQYNSQDSAGIYAKYFHPSKIMRYPDQQEYQSDLIYHLRALEPEPFVAINEDKLTNAMDAYSAYHAAEICNSAPERIVEHRCYSCDEEDVNDDMEYYLSGDNRICSGCWIDHYCSRCEQHHEDCACDDEDENY